MISANSVAVEFTGAPAGFLELSTSWQLLHTVPAGTGFVDFVTLRWDERSQALVELRVTDAGGTVVALMRNQQRYMPPVVSVLPTYKVYVRAPGAQLGQTRFSIYLFGHVERSLTATAVLGVGAVTVNGVSYGTVASGDTLNVEVEDGGGSPVGSLAGGVWVVP